MKRTLEVIGWILLSVGILGVLITGSLTLTSLGNFLSAFADSPTAVTLAGASLAGNLLGMVIFLAPGILLLRYVERHWE